MTALLTTTLCVVLVAIWLTAEMWMLTKREDAVLGLIYSTLLMVPLSLIVLVFVYDCVLAMIMGAVSGSLEGFWWIPVAVAFVASAAAIVGGLYHCVPLAIERQEITLAEYSKR